MRRMLMALTLSVGLYWVAWGQGPGAPAAGPQPPVPVAPAPQDAQRRLDEVLASWENDSQSLISAAAAFTQRKKYNHLQGQTVQFAGLARFMRLDPKTFAALIEAREYQPDGTVSADRYEKYLFTGAYLYTFFPREKRVLVQGLAQGQQAGAAVPFFVGMSRQELLERYDMQVAKLDVYYTYINIWPKLAALKQDFEFARLTVANQDITGKDQRGQPVLAIPKFMPRELYWIEPNKSEVTWDMAWVARNPPESVVKRDDFVAGRHIPQGWKTEVFQAPTPPQPGGPIPPPRR
jgi:TIGR03009 family protein